VTGGDRRRAVSVASRLLGTGGLARLPSGSARGDYRPALDGVRAVAVLAVIAYHVTSKRPTGGFLGVDVFFVLSGYLITTLLLRGHARSGRIRLSEFWARRARRLLPGVMLLVAACAVVIASSAPVATVPARRSDLLATLLYYANWHFIASDQSYFAMFTGASPLRHAWSLAIEEQFYLVWPLVVLIVLYLAAGRRRILFALIVLGIGVSVARMASLYDAANPSRSYYGTDTRAHALLIGAALAVLLLRRPALLTHARARAAATWLGPVMVLAVLAAFATVGEESYFYYHGGSALFALAVAAALWVIEAVPGSIPGSVLSWAPLRWVGRVSYGLYLWHWPMGIWLSAPSLGLADRPRQVLEVALTFAAATASFYLVEWPVRRGVVPWLRLSRIRLAVVAPVALAVVAGLALKCTSLGAPLARQIAETSYAACPPGSPSAGSTYFAWCSRTAPAKPDSTVVATIGDSTSRVLDPGMRRLARARGWRYIQAGIGGCSILPLTLPRARSESRIAFARDCLKYVPTTLAQVTAAYHPDIWIVADRYPGIPLLQDGRFLTVGDPRRAKIVATAMRSTLQKLTANGARVVIVAALPPGEPVECATQRPAPRSCSSVGYTTAEPQASTLNSEYRRASGYFPGKVTVVSVDDVLCPRGRCLAVIDGTVARYDTLHYTVPFSRKIVPVIVARAERAGIAFTRR
jgi:peptidoglycan/LPS O-acetylase OafA/YrhL